MEVNTPQPLETSQEVVLNELENRSLPYLWSIGGWLPAGKDMQIRLSANGPTGVTREELQKIERLAGRKTIDPEANIPIYLEFNRSDNGRDIQMQLSRYSATENLMQPIMQVSGDITSFKGEIATLQPKGTSRAVLPVFDKIAPLARELIANKLIRDAMPNQMLQRTYFTTNNPDVWWLELDSPACDLHAETRENPLRRLHVNLDFQDMAEYQEFMRELVETCRNYTDDPLTFKALFSGKGMEEDLFAPDTTKIVFYFQNNKDGKTSADRFAKWLIKQPIMQGRTPGRLHEIITLGQGGIAYGQGASANTLLLAKGFKEDRADVEEKLAEVRPGEPIDQKLLEKAFNLSLRYEV